MFPVARHVESIWPANLRGETSGSMSCFCKETRTQFHGLVVIVLFDLQMSNLFLPSPLLVIRRPVPSLIPGGAAVSGTAWMAGNRDPMVLPASEVEDPLLRETRRVFKEFMER